MLRREALSSAGDAFLEAALTGDGWEDALVRLSTAAEAGGAVLMRNINFFPAAAIWTSEIDEPVREFLAGRAPPNSRQVRARHPIAAGFRIDHDDYSDQELKHDPYYQEFLRPRGFFWHANVQLSHVSGQEVSLSLKRRLQSGPYERRDAAALNSTLEGLTAAVRIARRVLDAEASGLTRVLLQRGSPVFELDAWGRVLRAHAVDPAWPGIGIKERRLIAQDRLLQPSIDRAVMTAVTPPQRPAVAVIWDQRGERRLLQVVPVTGRARDIFLATSAVAVLIEPKRRPPAGILDLGMLRAAFGLTDREAVVAAFLAEGLSLPELAKHLGLQVGTARNHLKSAFEKTGTTRQGDLVALLARLKP